MLKFSHFWLNLQNTFYIIWDLYILVSGLQFLQDLQEMNDSFFFYYSGCSRLSAEQVTHLSLGIQQVLQYMYFFGFSNPLQ